MERLKAWLYRHRLRYRFYRLDDNYRRKRIGLEDYLAQLADLFAEVDPELNRTVTREHLITITTAHADAVFKTVKALDDALQHRTELKFNRNMIAAQEGEVSIYDWLYVPLARNYMSVSDYIRRVNHHYQSIQAQTKNEPATYDYIHRQIAAYTTDLLTALKAVEVLVLD